MAQQGTARRVATIARKSRTAASKKVRGKKEEEEDDSDFRRGHAAEENAEADTDVGRKEEHDTPASLGGYKKPTKLWISKYEEEVRVKEEQLHHNVTPQQAEDNDEAKATPAEPTAEPAQEVSNNACASPERVTDAASSPAPPAMPSPEKVEAARVEAEEELREEHELQAEEEMENSMLRDNEMAESLHGEPEVTGGAAPVSTGAAESLAEQAAGDSLQNGESTRKRRRSPISAESDNDQDVSGCKFAMDTDEAKDKPHGNGRLPEVKVERAPDAAVDMEIDPVSEVEDCGSRQVFSALKHEEGSVLAPLFYMLRGGSLRERLGEVDLSRIANYRELETAIREKSAGNLPGDTSSLQLCYQDITGDVLLLRPDDPWPELVATARSVVIICT